MNNENLVGTKIKELRTNIGMSAKDLANNAQISVGMLSQLENGSTQGSVETLRKIARVLNTTLAQLFTDESRMIEKPLNDESFYVVRSESRRKISS